MYELLTFLFPTVFGLQTYRQLNPKKKPFDLFLAFIQINAITNFIALFVVAHLRHRNDIIFTPAFVSRYILFSSIMSIGVAILVTLVDKKVGISVKPRPKNAKSKK